MQSGEGSRSIAVAGQGGLRHVARAFRAMLICLALVVSAQAATLNEDDLLLLDFVMERQRLASSVTGYAVGDTTVVSLAEAGAALEFPIVVDPAAGTASGSFIRPERSFSLDMNGGYVEIEGKRLPFSRDEVILHDESVFVSLEALSRWFPVDFRLDASALSVEVVPREPLPIQERQARRSRVQQISSVGPATLPPIDNAYRLLGPPAADIGLGYWTRRNQDRDTSSTGLNYSALLSADVAYMDARVYLGGSDQSALSNLRASLSRDRLGLPLGLRYVELGDIMPAIVPGLSFRGLERGILVQGGGSVVGRDDLIDTNTINISGDVLPGWDVELFQNGMRVGFQSVGEDGRYNFTNLDPLSGENEFEVVFYGPAGERRTEKLTRYSGLEPDQPGSVRYQLSVSKKGEQLYEGDDLGNTDLSDRGSTRVAAGLEMRVLPRLALRGSWNSVKVDGKQLNYTSLGLRTGFNDISLNVDATRDPLGGTRWDGALQLPARMRFGGFDTRLSYTQYAQSALVESPLGVDEYELRLRSRAGVTLSGPIGPVATRFSLFHNREEERSSTSLSAGFTSRLDRVVFGNTFNYYRFGQSRSGFAEPDRFSGNLFFSTRFHPLSVRGGVAYELSPKTEARQYFIDSNLRVAQDMSMNFGLTYDPLSGITRYISGFNWQLPQLTLSPRVSYDSEGEFSGFVYASFSLAPRPDRAGLMFSGRSLATTGAVAARVFVDHDGSNSLSDGDEPLSGVTVRAPQAFRNAATDENGVAYLTAMSSARATDIVVVEDTLPSAQLASRHAGNSVRPRPTAAVVIDFPVVPTGEIDGRVYVSVQGVRRALPGAMVELRDPAGEVVDFKVSAHDGFFVFSDVPYGTYVLLLAGSRRDSANQPMVVLSRDRSVHSAIDIVAIQDASTISAPRSVTPQPVVAANAVPPEPVRSAPTAAAPLSAVRAPPVANPVVAKRPLTGRIVQLGVFSSPENANAHRQAVLARGVVTATQIEVVSADLGARGVLYRVLARPLSTTADALCNSLKARGTECVTIVL